MQYRKFVEHGDNLSALGYGCLRFPTKNGAVDRKLAEEQLLYAYNLGVNYYDTGYIYHAGQSETVLGEFIEKYKIRDKVYIADKLPTFLVSKAEHIEKYFNTQLSRLKTEYIDYYLMHMLDSVKSFEKLCDFGLLTFLEQKKKKGEIRYVGFSFHGKQEEFLKLLEIYPWDFCQIQYNYLDENIQAGKKGLERAYEKGMGVIIMEPLRGGSLANNAPTKAKQIFSSFTPKHTAAYWGLRFVLNHKEVTCVLSGMNEISHIEENVQVTNDTKPLCMSHAELNVISKVKDVYKSLMKVPCTGCNYCMPCPYNVDIPTNFSDFNSKYFFGKAFSNFHYLYRATGGRAEGKTGADLCVSCGKCKTHCPQSIQIPQMLKEAHKALNNPILNPVFTLFFKFKHNNKKKLIK